MSEPEKVSFQQGLAWNALKNSAYGLLEFAWPVLIALVASPYIVNTLGNDIFGLFSIVGVTLGFFGFLDLGISGAVVRHVSALNEKGEYEGVNRVIGTALAFYLTIGVLGAALILLLTNTLVTRVLSIPPEFVTTAKLAFYISAPAFAVSVVVGTFSGIPRALQRFDIAAKLSILFKTLSTLSIVLLLYLGKGIIAVLATGVLINILAFPVYWRVDRQLVPTLRLRPSFDPALFRQLSSFGAAFFLSSMGVLALYQLDKLLIGSMISVAAVTYYVVPSNLAQKVQQLVASMTAVVFPMSSALSESNQRASLCKLYFEGSRLVQMLILTITIPMAAFADKFLLFWMGPEIARESAVPMVLLVATYGVLSIPALPWGIANGSGRAIVNAVFTIGIAVVNVLLFLVLVKPFGVAGAAMAYLSAAAIGVPLFTWYVERRILGLSGFEFMKIFWRAGLTGVFQCGVALLLRPLAVNLAVVLVLMLTAAAAFPFLYWAFGFLQVSDRRLVSLFVQRFRG